MKIKLRAALLGILFFFWTASFLWASIGLGWIARLVDVMWLFVILINIFRDLRYRSLVRKIAPISLLFIVLMGVTYLTDADSTFKDILYLKTLFYVEMAIFSGCLLGSLLTRVENAGSTFLKVSAWIASFFNIGYFIYSLNLGWSPGELLLKTSVAEYYQGISRLVVVSIIVVVVARKYLPFFVQILGIALGSLIAISFLGGGALIGLGLAIVWIIVSSFREAKIIRYRIILSTLMIIILIPIGLKKLNIDDVLFAYQKRIISKLYIQGNSNIKEGRWWLMSKGVSLWLKEPVTVIAGSGPINYSINIGYEEEFRHPHNILVLSLVWFGIMAIPLFLATADCIKRVITLLKSRSEVGDLAIVLFVFYLGMAMIGGDFEQNRHYFFICGFVYSLSSAMCMKTRSGAFLDRQIRRTKSMRQGRQDLLGNKLELKKNCFEK